WIYLVDVVGEFTCHFHDRGRVVPNVLVAIDGRDLVRMPFLSMITVVEILAFRGVVVAVRGQRQRVDDLVLVFDGVVEPGIVSATTHDDDIGFRRARQICRGGLKVVRVHIIALND